jgi:hypothetical protein
MLKCYVWHKVCHINHVKPWTVACLSTKGNFSPPPRLSSRSTTLEQKQKIGTTTARVVTLHFHSTLTLPWKHELGKEGETRRGSFPRLSSSRKSKKEAWVSPRRVNTSLLSFTWIYIELLKRKLEIHLLLSLFLESQRTCNMYNICHVVGCRWKMEAKAPSGWKCSPVRIRIT